VGKGVNENAAILLRLRYAELTVGEDDQTFFFIDKALGNGGTVLLLAADLLNGPVPIDDGDIFGTEALVNLRLIDISRGTTAQDGFLNGIVEVFIDVLTREDGKALFLSLCSCRFGC